MKTLTKIETYFRMIEEIDYENPNGGAYAYVQYLAYTRELLKLLRPFKKVERQLEALDGISWLFNEYLAAKFTHRQKAIFESKLIESREIFDSIRHGLRQFEVENPVSSRILHRQAA
jgi:hypothetical protein